GVGIGVEVAGSDDVPVGVVQSLGDEVDAAVGGVGVEHAVFEFPDDEPAGAGIDEGDVGGAVGGEVADADDVVGGGDGQGRGAQAGAAAHPPDGVAVGRGVVEEQVRAVIAIEVSDAHELPVRVVEAGQGERAV